MLLNLQGNILKGHGRDNTWNIFFLLGNDLLKSKRVLRDLGNHRVTNAYKQLLESEAFKTENKPGGTFCAVFISAQGYKKLEFTFAPAAGNDAFGQGMKHEESRKALGGITYEDTARMIHPDGLPAVDSKQEFIDQVQGHLPESSVGLLFMAYNAKLDNQFVFTQRQWANFAAFPKAPAPPGLDAVIGQNANEPGGQIHAKEWDNPAAGSEPFDFKGFVTMKGGEYFFAPSLTFLRDL
jgi:deferrochelatase/peroxidase EfeB